MYYLDAAPPLRLRRRPRLSGRQLVGPVIAIGLVLVALVLLATQAYGRSPQPQRTITVHSGDSLWSIAATEYPQSDTRERVAQIEDLNHLGGASVVLGQRLVLPAS